MLLESKKSDYEVIPFGIYRLRLRSIEDAAKPADWLANPDPTKPLPDTHQWLWKFVVVGTEYEGTELWLYTARTVGTSATGTPYKARVCVNALLDRDMVGDEIDDAILVGRECMGKVDDKKKNGEPGNRIISLDRIGTPIAPLVPRVSAPLTNEEGDFIPSPSELSDRYLRAKAIATEAKDGTLDRLKIAYSEIVGKGVRKGFDELAPALQFRVVLEYEDILGGEVPF